MKLQSCGEIFFYIRRGKRKKSLQMQHMISTWGCRNSEFISREGNKARRGRENQEPERKERVRGGGRGTQRGKERGSDWRERRGGKSKKKLGGKRGERERSERADTTCGCGGSDPVMEGDKFSGKTNSRSSQLRGTQLLPSVQLDLLLFCDRDTFLLPSAFPPLCGIFHLLILACLLTACFLGDLELEALQSFCSSFGYSCQICNLFCLFCLPCNILCG